MLTGRLVGMADDADSKSVAGNRVRVQVPQPAVTKGPGKAMKNSALFRAFSQTKRWIMDCYTAEQKITGFIQNELDDAETEAFLNHIRSCESCAGVGHSAQSSGDSYVSAGRYRQKFSNALDKS